MKLFIFLWKNCLFHRKRIKRWCSAQFIFLNNLLTNNNVVQYLIIKRKVRRPGADARSVGPPGGIKKGWASCSPRWPPPSCPVHRRTVGSVWPSHHHGWTRSSRKHDGDRSAGNASPLRAEAQPWSGCMSDGPSYLSPRRKTATQWSNKNAGKFFCLLLNKKTYPRKISSKQSFRS